LLDSLLQEINEEMATSFGVDPFDKNDGLPLDLLDTEGFFSSDQLGVSELDMAGLADVDLVSLDRQLGEAGEGAVTQLEGWPSPVVDVNLNCAEMSLSEIDQHLAEAAGQECLEEDFQKMLNEWESHIGSLAGSESDSLPQVSENTSITPQPQLKVQTSPHQPLRLGSPHQRQLPVSSGLRSPVLPRPGVTYTRVAGLGPRVTSRSSPSYITSVPVPALSPLRSPPVSPPTTSKDWFLAPTSSCPSATLPDNIKFSNCTSDLSTTLENQKRRMEWLESNFQRNSSQTHQEQSGSNVKIIAAVSPGKDGQSTTRILSSRSVKDTLPRELIEKIKAASQGRKTIAIIEPVNKDRNNVRGVMSGVGGGMGRSKPWQPSTQAKWRHVGIVSPLQSHNISDHDYCSPNKPALKGAVRRNTISSPTQPTYCPVPVKQEVDCMSQVLSVGSNTDLTFARQELSPVGSVKGRDSGLESEELSDGSEDGLYDKLPPYLTSVSVQTGQDGDQQYSRMPQYLTTTTTKHRQSLLKTNLVKQDIVEVQSDLVGESDNSNIGVTATPESDRKDRVENKVRDNSSDAKRGSCSRDRERRQRRRSRSRSRSPRDKNKSRGSGSRDSRRRSRSSSRRRRRRSGSRYRSRSRRSSWGRRNERLEDGAVYDREKEKKEQERRHRQQERQRQVEERRVVYVGRIQEGTLKADLRSRFQVFGPIVDISVHFRDHGDNYGFVTFQYKVDAYAAVEHGNDDPSLPQLDLCFGGRRAFCKEKYFDLDDVEDGGLKGDRVDFDQLLAAARVTSS